MGHLERGEKNVSFSTIMKVASALGVPLSELFEGLEAGSASRAARGRPSQLDLNHQMLAKEVAVLEGAVRRLKNLALQQATRRTKSGKRQP